MEHRVYRPDQRPDIEVLVDGVRCDGELRMWSQREDGTWDADVQWRPNGEPTRRLDTFAADQIRLAEKAPSGPGPRGLFPISDDDSFDRRSLESEVGQTVPPHPRGRLWARCPGAPVAVPMRMPGLRKET